MNKLFVGGLLLTKLIIQDPELAHSKVVEFSDTNKSNVITVLENTPAPLTLDEINTRESIIADSIMNDEFYIDFMKDLKNGKASFFDVIDYFSDKEEVKFFFYDEILREFNKKDFPKKILDNYFIKKYGEDLYSYIRKYFLNNILLIALENPDYNIFVDGKNREFYELTPELLSMFQQYGLEISGNPSNFYFTKQEDGSISMLTSESNKETIIATISKSDINETYDKVFNVVHDLIQMIEGV